jgi:hypothetical protein
MNDVLVTQHDNATSATSSTSHIAVPPKLDSVREQTPDRYPEQSDSLPAFLPESSKAL